MARLNALTELKLYSQIFENFQKWGCFSKDARYNVVHDTVRYDFTAVALPVYLCSNFSAVRRGSTYEEQTVSVIGSLHHF